MQFNDTSTSLGVCQEIDALCDSDTTTYPVADKTRRVNIALETLVAKIINADGTWQFDDTNYTDTPVGTGTLIEGQSQYSFASEYLDIEWIKIKDLNGNWVFIKPIDQSQVSYPLEEFLTTDGMPEFYDKEGDTIRLYPAPTATAVTLASGIKVKFKRTADLFEASDTIKEPGIPSPFHVLLAYMASVPFCMSYKKDRVALYEKKIDEMTNELIKFFGRREKDKRKIITMKSILFR